MSSENNKASGFTYQHIPDAMKQIPHWILFRLVWRPEKNKWDKVPTQASGQPASVTNPAHYSTFEDAQSAYMLGTGDGIGFCFTGRENLVFVDIDGAVRDGAWAPEHLHVMQQFATWGEMSQSGKGVHLICEGTLDRARVHHPAGLELYNSGRFVAMTGWQLSGWPAQVSPCQASVDWLAAHIDALKGSTSQLTEYQGQEKPEMEEPLDPGQLPISKDVYNFLTQGLADKWDQDRSRAMLAASMSLYRCGLTDGQVLGTMWYYCGYIAQEHRQHGDATEWLWKYSVSPGQGAKPPSSDELFAQVPTTDTDKLQELLAQVSSLECGSVTDTDTIHRARALLAESLRLDAGSRIAIQDAIRKAMTWTKSETSTVLKELEREARRQNLEQHGGIQNLMDGYLYVAGMHAFLHKESGELLKPEAFVALHTHMSSEIRDIVLSGDGVAKVTGLDFDPGQPEFFYRYGALYYNSWRGLTNFGVPGDITPWWNHLCLLVPKEREREHLLNWMAWTLQQPHRKINHAVVMGGHYGIGKDTLFWPMDQALGRHSKQVGAEALTRDHNEYLMESKLVTFQEIEMGSHREAKQIDNRLKPMIASPPDTLYVNPKGVSAFHIQNVVHIVMFHNGDHPVVINDGDRRYFVLSSDVRVTDPQTGEQRPEWREYFNQLWYWLDQCAGWQAVTYYLLTRDVSKFNPKAAPPMTEGKLDIIEQGRTGLEALVRDALDNSSGPFVNDVLLVDQIIRWLSTDGIAMLQSYGIKEIPSPVVVGRALKAAMCVSRRVRLSPGGSQVRAWICRNHQQWGQAEAPQLTEEIGV